MKEQFRIFWNVLARLWRSGISVAAIMWVAFRRDIAIIERVFSTVSGLRSTAGSERKGFFSSMIMWENICGI